MDYNSPEVPCADEEYLEIRDGYNQSGNLLGVFCGRYVPRFKLRSSGQNMWLRFSPRRRYRLWRRYYEGKALNATCKYSWVLMFWFTYWLIGIIYCGWYVLLCLCLDPTNLKNVAKTQFVLLNHLSSLWCPAEGGPAPRIVWRKNDAVVQNSTSVRLQINVTEEERNTSYSCEVDDHGLLKRKNISLVVESKSQVTSLLQGGSVFVYAFGKPYSLSWVNLRIFGFRMKPSTILFKGNMKSHIYDIKHKIRIWISDLWRSIQANPFSDQWSIKSTLDKDSSDHWSAWSKDGSLDHWPNAFLWAKDPKLIILPSGAQF